MSTGGCAQHLSHPSMSIATLLLHPQSSHKHLPPNPAAVAAAAPPVSTTALACPLLALPAPSTATITGTVTLPCHLPNLTWLLLDTGTL
jgi:hypothetical protein